MFRRLAGALVTLGFGISLGAAVEQAPKATTVAPPPEDVVTAAQTALGGPASDAITTATRSGNLSLDRFDVATRRPARATSAEKMIRKLRAGQMPPPAARRPAEARARRARRRRSKRRLDARRARADAGPPHVPAPESRRVRARRSTTCSRSTSTPATTCRSTPRAPTSTTSPTRSCCRRR